MISTKLQDCNSIKEYVNTITMTYTLKEFNFEVKEEIIGALLLIQIIRRAQAHMIISLENADTIVTSSAIKRSDTEKHIRERTENKQKKTGSGIIFESESDT